jgi:hypothetical protein
MHIRASVLGCLLVAACGGDGGSAFQGIYDVDTWTINDGTCDAEGPSVLETETQTMFYLKNESFLGIEFLNLKFCDDQNDCETLAGDPETIHLGRYGFDQGGDGGGWTSEWYSGFENDMTGLCEGSYFVVKLTGEAGASVRVEARETPAGGFPPGEDGFCDDEPGKAAAEGQPCTGFEVITASFVSDLP